MNTNHPNLKRERLEKRNNPNINMIRSISTTRLRVVLVDTHPWIHQQVQNACELFKVQVDLLVCPKLKILQDHLHDRPHLKVSFFLLDSIVALDDQQRVVHLLRQHSQHQHIPIIVWGEENQAKEYNRLIKLGINSCIIRPEKEVALQKLTHQLLTFWGLFNITI